MNGSNRAEELAKLKIPSPRVRRTREIVFDGCTVSLWVCGSGFIPGHVAIVEASGQVYESSEGVASFSRFLHDARVDIAGFPLCETSAALASFGGFRGRERIGIADLPAFDVLFAMTSPQHCRITYPDSFSPDGAVWPAPRVVDGALVLHCNNYCSGKTERWTIFPDYRIAVEVVGDGIRDMLR